MQDQPGSGQTDRGRSRVQFHVERLALQQERLEAGHDGRSMGSRRISASARWRVLA